MVSDRRQIFQSWSFKRVHSIYTHGFCPLNKLVWQQLTVRPYYSIWILLMYISVLFPVKKLIGVCVCVCVKSENLWWRCIIKMTKLFEHFPSSYLLHDVSETGICLCHQVKNTPSLLGPTDRASLCLQTSVKWAQQTRCISYLMTETDSSLRNVVF
jgi:hypothetical protein